MDKFKVGDRVYVVDSMQDDFCTIGDRGNVQGITPMGNLDVLFDHSKKVWCVHTKQVIHVDN